MWVYGLTACRNQKQAPVEPPPEPLDEITPEVNEGDSEKEAEVKDIGTMAKEIAESVNALNSMVKDVLPQDERLLRKPAGNPYEDGERGTVEVQKKKAAPGMLVTSLLDGRNKMKPFASGTVPGRKGLSPRHVMMMSNAFSSLPKLSAPRRRGLSGLPNLPNLSGLQSLPNLPMNAEEEEERSANSGYDEKSFVLYRSKQKTMLRTQDVYDVGATGRCED